MNTDKRRYSDSELDDYEMKRNQFKKRKNSKSKKKETLDIPVKRCKRCKQYMHNVAKHNGYCESCYKTDCNDQFIYTVFDNTITVFAILQFMTFLFVPFRVIPAILICIDEYFEYKYTPYLVMSSPIAIAGIGMTYIYIGIKGSDLMLSYIYGYAFLPIMKLLYGYTTQEIEVAIKRKYKFIPADMYLAGLN